MRAQYCGRPTQRSTYRTSPYASGVNDANICFVLDRCRDSIRDSCGSRGGGVKFLAILLSRPEAFSRTEITKDSVTEVRHIYRVEGGGALVV